MLQSTDNASKLAYTPSTNNPVTPVKTMTSPIEQATIGRTLVIKGEISGSESLYIDGRVEGTITFKDHRVTVGRNGVVQSNISAREVVIMGKVTGDVVSQRISVEDGALLRGSVQLTPAEQKQDKHEAKAMGAAAGK